MKGFLSRFFTTFIMISVVVVVYAVITNNLDFIPWALVGGATGSAILVAVLRK